MHQVMIFAFQQNLYRIEKSSFETKRALEDRGVPVIFTAKVNKNAKHFNKPDEVSLNKF